MTKTSNSSKPVVRIKTSEDLSFVKFELNELKEMIKSDKKDIVGILDRVVKLLGNINETQLNQEPPMVIEKTPMVIEKTPLVIEKPPTKEISKKEYRGVHLIWDHDKPVHWKGWQKNPNYDASYAMTYTNTYYPLMDINEPKYNPFFSTNRTKTLRIVKELEELPIGWKIFPSKIKKKKNKICYI